MKQLIFTKIHQKIGRLKQREWKEMRKGKEDLWGKFSWNRGRVKMIWKKVKF